MTANPERPAGLPIAQFGFPGPLRERLVELILTGRKTATTSLLAGYQAGDEPLPEVGRRSVLVDSAEKPAGLLETTAVRVVRLDEVDLRHVLDEAEGHATDASWSRVGHEEFWSSQEMLAALGDPAFRVDDETQVVLERFRLVP